MIFLKEKYVIFICDKNYISYILPIIEQLKIDSRIISPKDISTYPKLNSKSLETMALASLIQD